MNDQESCVINGGVTAQHFKLETDVWQGDPVSAYLFMSKFLEIPSYILNADDTTFFLKNLGSAKELLNIISLFPSFSGLKPNLSKYKVAGIGLLKGVKVAVCGIKCIDLTKDAIKY